MQNIPKLPYFSRGFQVQCVLLSMLGDPDGAGSDSGYFSSEKCSIGRDAKLISMCDCVWVL